MGAATGAPGAAREPAPGRAWILPLAGTAAVKMAWIPPGIFLMGSPPSEPLRRADEGPVTRVMLRHGYWLGTTMVTIGQWPALMGRGVREQLATALPDTPLHPLAGPKHTLRPPTHLPPTPA